MPVTPPPITRLQFEIASVSNPSPSLIYAKTNLPVLIMELLDESLTDFLDSHHQQPLPYETETRISYDIALGLSFLHYNDIIHRDLSSNNVLMLGSLRAKIADFGMAKIFNGCHFGANTKNPGNASYMPPEVKTDDPKLVIEIDIFSFGVLLVQILTRCFPAPNEKASGLLGLLKSDQEIGARQNHISLIDNKHPLLPTVLACLKDDWKKRPNSVQLCRDLENAKDRPYVKNGEKLEENSIKKDAKNEPEAKPLSNSTIIGPSPEVDRIENPRPNSMPALPNNEDFFSVNPSDVYPIPHAETTPTTAPIPDKSKELNIICSLKSTSTPHPVSRTADAVYLNNCIYLLTGSQRRTLYKFQHVSLEWSRLKETPMALSVLAVVGQEVVTIGGCKGYLPSDKLFCLEKGNWKEVSPSMPTSRYDVILASCETHVIVAGGMGKNKEILDTVEVLDIEKHEWLSVSSLPEPAACLSGCISRDKVWIAGYNFKIFSCYLKSLLESARKTWFGFQSNSFPNFWVNDKIPVYSSTLVVVNGDLYAVGGKLMESKRTTNAVYQYSSWNGRWYIVSYMNMLRSDCLAVGIARKRQLVVMGGVSDSGVSMNTVEVARFLKPIDARSVNSSEVTHNYALH